MAYNNTVYIISNSDFAITEIKNMLVLLREVDRVESGGYRGAESSVAELNPNVIILHASENDKNCIELTDKIRNNPKTSTIPIILYANYCDSDFVVEAFDHGISDIITAPLKDYELVIRVIWAIRANENNLIAKVKNDFLEELGIIDTSTGLYKEEFGLKFMKKIFNRAEREKCDSCLMMLQAISVIEGRHEQKKILDAIKSSVRVNDTIALKDKNTFIIFLSKAKLNGLYAIYERITSKLGSTISLSASISELNNETFDELIDVLEYVLNKKENKGEINLVKREDFIEMDSKKESYPEFEESEDIIEIPENSNMQYPPKSAAKTEDIPIEKNTELGFALKEMDEKIKDFEKTPHTSLKKLAKKKANASLILNDTNEQGADERNAALYRQAYLKKLKIIIAPMLKRYAAKFQSDFAILDANINVTSKITFLRMEKDEFKLNFEICYDQIKTLSFKLGITALKTEVESDSFEMSVTELDSEKLKAILDTLTEEYRNYLTS